MERISNETLPTSNSFSGSTLWIILNLIIIVATILGNILTISAILLSRKLSSIIANQFIFSLAVSDLMVGLSIPYHMAFYLSDSFGQEKIDCLLRFILLVFACSSSIMNLLIIATDRYIAIIYPLHYNRYMTRKASAGLIVFGWLMAFALASIPFYWNEWCQGVSCELVQVLPQHYMNFLILPMFLSVWLILLLLYTKIFREASGHAKRLRSATSSNNLMSTPVKDSKSFQVMITILGCFSICWLPFFAITTYLRITKDMRTLMYEMAFTLAVSNSGMNPLIYAWKNTNFRKAFGALVRCKSPNSANGNNFVTNHVPSKKNSLNGICNGRIEDVIRSEADMERMCTRSQSNEQDGGSAITELTNISGHLQN